MDEFSTVTVVPVVNTVEVTTSPNAQLDVYESGVNTLDVYEPAQSTVEVPEVKYSITVQSLGTQGPPGNGAVVVDPAW